MSEELGPIGTIILLGSALEAAIPWLAMWLSDVLVFDIPRWALWPLFGAPPTLTICAALGYWFLKACARRKPA